jgi:rhodanese-related sulfurtransferase
MAITEVTPREAQTLLDEDALLLDVRNTDEWDLGHAPTATFITLSELPDHLDELPRDRTIVCACRSGGRSLRAATFLADEGFDVVNLTGGMLAWHAEDRPFVSDDGDARIE